MSFTGQLGTVLSQPGSILLGSIGSTPLTISVSDSLNNWQDTTARQLGHFLQLNDTLVLSDSARVVLELNRIVGDDLNNWLDDIAFFIFGVYFVNVSDNLNNWFDFIERTKTNEATPQLVYKPDEVIYLRRYLNDVVIENLGEFTSSARVIYKAGELVYLRRYLNDV